MGGPINVKDLMVCFRSSKLFGPEDKGTTPPLRNVGDYLSVDMLQHPKVLLSS